MTSKLQQSTTTWHSLLSPPSVLSLKRTWAENLNTKQLVVNHLADLDVIELWYFL